MSLFRNRAEIRDEWGGVEVLFTSSPIGVKKGKKVEARGQAKGTRTNLPWIEPVADTVFKRRDGGWHIGAED